MSVMKKTVVFSTVLMLICCQGTSYAFEEEWRLALDKDAIQVYARPLPHSVLKEYRAEIILDEDICSVAAVLDDIPAAVKWFPFCVSAGVIDELADGRKIVINVSDFPWPFQDRYAVFSSRKAGDCFQKQIIIDFAVDDLSNARPVDDIENADNMVKIAFMKGQWVLSMVDSNKTKMTYTICADAGGNVPQWLVKTFFDETPYATLKNLREFVNSPEYQESRMPER